MDNRPYTELDSPLGLSYLRAFGDLEISDLDLSPEVEKNAVIFCHGCRYTASESPETWFEAVHKALDDRGYDGDKVGRIWRSDLSWRTSIESAESEGERLAEYAEKFFEESPEGSLHLIGYSLGAKVFMEAQRLLPQGKNFDSIHLLGGALKPKEFETVYQNVADSTSIHNYRNSKDMTLAFLFPLSGAVGKQGLKSKKERFQEYEIDFGDISRFDIHGAHIQIGSPSLEKVARNIEEN